MRYTGNLPVHFWSIDRTYLLDEVEETGEHLGVTVVLYKGTRCAAKTLPAVILESGDPGGVGLQRRHWMECVLHCQLRHPNIVQFLGYYNQGNVPCLVMELLLSDLSQCIDCYGVLPTEISYSILQDAALGLRYLHEHCQPIIHRNLTAKAVLLTDDMTAKIGSFQ